jgi:hypothetical protein
LLKTVLPNIIMQERVKHFLNGMLALLQLPDL